MIKTKKKLKKYFVVDTHNSFGKDDLTEEKSAVDVSCLFTFRGRTTMGVQNVFLRIFVVHITICSPLGGKKMAKFSLATNLAHAVVVELLILTQKGCWYVNCSRSKFLHIAQRLSFKSHGV